MTAQEDVKAEPSVKMWGGPWVSLLPFGFLIGLLTILSVAERASIPAFWVGGWAAIALGVLLTRTHAAFAASIIRGLSDSTGALIITAFIFAGVFGVVLSNGGLTTGILWFGLETDLAGRWFTVLAFVLAIVFGAGVGTSAGVVIALLPVLYPAGIYLGADPTMLAVAILAGAACGDNISPVSDTLLASAYTQKAELADVVRSRLPLALTAALISVPVLVIFGEGGEVTGRGVAADADASGLLMFIPLVVVVVLAMRRQHIIISLVWGTLTAIGIGVATALITPSQLFSIPESRDVSTGLIEDGIASVTAPIVLVLFILGLGQLLADTGLIARVLAALEERAARGVKSAELTILAVTVLFSVPLGTNAPVVLLVGQHIARPLGRVHHLAPARVANLLDCGVATIYYMLPWHNIVLIWYATLVTTSQASGTDLPSVSAAFLNPYSWALLVVLLVSIATGWNRRLATDAGAPEGARDDEARQPG